MFDRKLVGQFDWLLLMLVVCISLIGFVSIYSASVNYAEVFPYYLKQPIWFALGLVVLFLIILFDYRLFCGFSFLFYLILIALLVAVLWYGTGGPGSRVNRWIAIGPLFLQPSEFAKFALVLYLANYFNDSRRINNLRLVDIVWPLCVTLIPFVLILNQPDLGTASVLLIAAISIIFLVGLRMKAILITGIGSLVSLPIIWFFILKSYQRDRILAMIDPESDPLGKGYQIIQSKIAIGSGKLWGKGFLEGTQAKLNFLPARHTDFIFSIFTEEWGFVGGITLIGLYVLLIARCLYYVGKTKDRSGTVLVVGVTSIFAAHIIINVGMVLGLFPIVGMPLPFMSYGGSAMISNMVGVGLILNVGMRRLQN